MPIFHVPRDELIFPDPSLAEREPNGVLGLGGDLSPERLLLAYRSGIFPWYSPGLPILWWSPDPRMVLYPGELHVPRRLRGVLRRCTIAGPGSRQESGPGRGEQDVAAPRFRISLDEAFEAVIAGCAAARRPGQDGTWITPEMQAAYCRLHALGHAHSCEAWREGELAGGVYGVALGRFFAAESMFYRVAEASKAALVVLVRQLARWDFSLIDCQVHTPHAARFGAREIPRAQYLAEFAAAVAQPSRPSRWTLDVDPANRAAGRRMATPAHSNARQRSGGQ